MDEEKCISFSRRFIWLKAICTKQQTQLLKITWKTIFYYFCFLLIIRKYFIYTVQQNKHYSLLNYFELYLNNFNLKHVLQCEIDKKLNNKTPVTFFTRFSANKIIQVIFQLNIFKQNLKFCFCDYWWKGHLLTTKNNSSELQ